MEEKVIDLLNIPSFQKQTNSQINKRAILYRFNLTVVHHVIQHTVVGRYKITLRNDWEDGLLGVVLLLVLLHRANTRTLITTRLE